MKYQSVAVGLIAAERPMMVNHAIGAIKRTRDEAVEHEPRPDNGSLREFT